MPRRPVERAGPPRAPPGSARMVLGIDEAGRGSVLGPLVVGGFLCSESELPELTRLGVRDSKRLAPARREELYGALQEIGRAWSVALSPSTVDRSVREQGLNRLEADAFAELVRRARPDAVFADSCDVRPERFSARIRERARFSGPVDARHHADRDLVVVGAASIIAKVRRDAAIRMLAQKVRVPIGSGYPSDPVTRAYLSDLLGPSSAALPAWVRKSWATVERVKRERSTVPLERFGT